MGSAAKSTSTTTHRSRQNPTMAHLKTFALLLLTLTIALASNSINQQWPDIDEQSFVWPQQWQGIQEIHLSSGPYVGAIQKGRIVYDYTNLRTREDQVLIAGPSVASNYTSNNMTEWFHNSTWFYMDWTTGQCMSNDFGIGMVLPDWLVAPDYPKHTGVSFIFTYINNTATRGYVNTTVPSSLLCCGSACHMSHWNSHMPTDSCVSQWIQTDGSAGFGLPAGTNLFDFNIDNDGVPRRLHMPSTLAADLMIDLTEYSSAVPLEDTALPEACLQQNVLEWPHGPVTPMASRFAAFSKMR